MQKGIGIVALLLLATAHPGVASAGQGGQKPAAAEGHVAKRDAAPAYLFAGGKGLAQLLINESTGAPDVAVSILTLAPGTNVPEHAHEGSSETLHIERGSVQVTVGGKTWTATAGDTVYLPAGVAHTAKVMGHVEPLRAVQVYVGPGPEQRFAKGKKVDTKG